MECVLAVTPRWSRNASGGVGCGSVCSPFAFLLPPFPGEPIGGKALYFRRSPSDFEKACWDFVSDASRGPECGRLSGFFSAFTSASVMVNVYCFSSCLLVQSIIFWLYSAILVSLTICWLKKKKFVTSNKTSMRSFRGTCWIVHFSAVAFFNVFQFG